jgi:hypothetical protein
LLRISNLPCRRSISKKLSAFRIASFGAISNTKLRILVKKTITKLQLEIFSMERGQLLLRQFIRARKDSTLTIVIVASGEKPFTSLITALTQMVILLRMRTINSKCLWLKF